MKQTFYNGLHYVQLESENLSNEGFIWGDQMIQPGHTFEHIGAKERSSIELNNAILEYCGRFGHELLFSIVTDAGSSKNDNCFICLSYVNSKVLLSQTSGNGFYDIRY